MIGDLNLMIHCCLQIQELYIRSKEVKWLVVGQFLSQLSV